MADRPQKLLTPGPTSVPPSVLRALSKPVLHHRSPDFAAVFELAQERLREVFRTENEVLVLTSSGTGAFESAVVNLLSPGERVLAVSQGEFGERWQAMARAFGCDVVPLTYPWGEAPRPAACARHWRKAAPRPPSSSTPRLRPASSAISSRSSRCAARKACSRWSMPFRAWAPFHSRPTHGAPDVVVTGSQKALMTPPGLAFAAVSDRAWERTVEATLPRFYWDWARQRRAQAKRSTPFTPPTSTVVALVEALGLVLEDGLDAAFARHRALGRACRAGIKAIGLELYSPEDDSAAVLTGALTPEGIDAVELRLALRDRHGITIAGGHGDLVSRLFRIGHIGHVTIDDIAEALGAIEVELREAGADVEPGRAAPAAFEAFGSVAATG